MNLRSTAVAMPAPAPHALIYRGDSRGMEEVGSGSVDLVVTSPPYWHIKDYGSPGQIGYGQSLHAYLRDLFQVWAECARAIRGGGRLCVNIGDQFARATQYGRYRVIPLHAEVICQCAAAGLDFLGSIIWRKKTTMNTTGGATVMGSYPFPPNGIVEIDYEHILLFKKPGKPREIPMAARRASAMSLEEWKLFFSGHWDIGGARKKGHEAPFPEEVPRRLIRMFSVVGDTILDPFIGTGTTARVALELGRNAIGYEVNADIARMAMERISPPNELTMNAVALREARGNPASPRATGENPEPPRGAPYVPRIPDIESAAGKPEGRQREELHIVVAVGADCSLELDSGTRVRFLGVRIKDRTAAKKYLTRRILRKEVFLKDSRTADQGAADLRAGSREIVDVETKSRVVIAARVFLKNRINVNSWLVKSGMAEPEEAAHSTRGHRVP